MQTYKIIDNQVKTEDLTNLILLFAFDFENLEYEISVFMCGYYERCNEILIEINELSLSKSNRSKLLQKLFNLACVGGNEGIIKLFDKQNVNWAVGFGQCCQNGDLKFVNSINKKYCRSNFIKSIIRWFNNDSDWLYHNGLVKACTNGNIDVIKYLLDRGVKISSLHLDVVYLSGNLEAIKLVYEKGRVNRVINKKQSNFLLKAACKNNQLDRVNEIIKTMNNQSFSINEDILGWIKNTEIYHLIISKLNLKGISNEKLLTPALRCKNMDIIEIVMKKINLKELNNCENILFALCHSSVEISKYIFKKIIFDIPTRKKYQDKLIAEACKFGHIEFIRFLNSKEYIP